MKFLLPLFLALSLLFGIQGCQAIESTQTELEQVKIDFQEDIAEADRLFLEGEITFEERAELIEQSRAIQERRLEEIANSLPGKLENEKEAVKAKARSGLYELAELALILLFGGGVGAGAVAARGAYVKRREGS